MVCLLYVSIPSSWHRLDRVVAGRPPRVRELAGSVPARIIRKSLKMVFSLALRVAGLALRLFGWCRDKRTSSTGNLHRKRQNKTEKMF